MASRCRVISQNKALYVTPTGWLESGENQMITGHQLHRVDTLSYDIDLAGARQDVREFGQLARIGTVNAAEINPTINFGYYPGDGENEKALGFADSRLAASSVQMASGLLTADPDYSERNLFVVTAKEGEDAFADSYETTIDNQDVIGFGNCFLSNYSATFNVGKSLG